MMEIGVPFCRNEIAETYLNNVKESKLERLMENYVNYVRLRVKIQ